MTTATHTPEGLAGRRGDVWWTVSEASRRVRNILSGASVWRGAPALYQFPYSLGTIGQLVHVQVTGTISLPEGQRSGFGCRQIGADEEYIVPCLGRPYRRLPDGAQFTQGPHCQVIREHHPPETQPAAQDLANQEG